MSEEKTIEWDPSADGIVDEAFLATRVHELHGVTRLRVGPASFYSKACLTQALVPTLRRISFSFFEVGPNAGGVLYKERVETNAALSAFEELKELEDLDLRWSYCIDDSGADFLAKLERLQSLSLESDITDDGLSRLAPLQHLRTLGLTCSRKITGRGFDMWPEMPCLRALVLSQCSSVGDEALQMVAKSPLLDYLVLSGCKNLTLAGLSRMKGSPKLRSISLHGVALDLATLRALRQNNPNATLECDIDQLPDADREEAGKICVVPRA